MNITDADGKWKLEHGWITNRKTGEIRRVQHTPSANTIACMPYKRYMQKCQIAFDTGAWPKTNWKSGLITD